MQECKNRAPGSLEWKDGEGERDEFKEWADANLAWDASRAIYINDDIAFSAWQARQPEIDALKAEIRHMEETEAEGNLQYGRCVLERGALRAENEKLRKAAVKFTEWLDRVESKGKQLPVDLVCHIRNLRAAMTAPDTKGE